MMLTGENYTRVRDDFIRELTSLAHFRGGFCETENDILQSIARTHGKDYSAAVGISASLIDRAPILLAIVNSFFGEESGLENGFFTSPMWANFLSDAVRRSLLTFRHERAYYDRKVIEDEDEPGSISLS